MTGPSLALHNVVMSFGGVQVLDDVSFHVDQGEVLGLIGPNGAGKTTLFQIVSGLLPPVDGRVVLNGVDVTRDGPESRARKGLARTFQRLELFRVLTARENVQVAADIRRRWARDRTPSLVTADELLARVGITHLADRRVDTLPTGSARLVEVARALATRPTVLLLDEPASGLDGSETTMLGELIADLARDGLSVVLVEHDIRLVMETCARVAVLDGGRVLAVGPPKEIRTNAAVQAAYLGPNVGDNV